jgi:5'-nucleotidase
MTDAVYIAMITSIAIKVWNGFAMRILVSNDDGVMAPGIMALAKALQVLGEVTVMAPDRDYSGASNSLTLTVPVRVHELMSQAARSAVDKSESQAARSAVDKSESQVAHGAVDKSESQVAHGAVDTAESSAGFKRYAVSGTPTDCVHLALCGFMSELPDIVVSGINNSSNLGDDTLYSGTVAAAMEGRNLGLPAVAVSLCSKNHLGIHYESAARAAVAVVRQLVQSKLPSDTLLNVNVPDLPWHEIKGYQVTRLGSRHRAEACTRQSDPRGKPVYWIGAAGQVADGGPGTDFDAVRNGYVSITPITMDLTRHSALDTVRRWIGDL